MFTAVVHVSGAREMGDYAEYSAWMSELETTLGVAPNPEARHWVTGDVHGRWTTDYRGNKQFDRSPYAHVWQSDIGGEVRSIAMAYVWIAIHLIQPLEAAGYTIDETWVGRSDEIVLIG